MSTKELFREIRGLERRALDSRLIEPYEIKTSEDMRSEAWECYLVSRLEWLKGVIEDSELI